MSLHFSYKSILEEYNESKFYKLTLSLKALKAAISEVKQAEDEAVRGLLELQQAQAPSVFRNMMRTNQAAKLTG